MLPDKLELHLGIIPELLGCCSSFAASDLSVLSRLLKISLQVFPILSTLKWCIHLFKMPLPQYTYLLRALLTLEDGLGCSHKRCFL